MRTSAAFSGRSNKLLKVVALLPAKCGGLWLCGPAASAVRFTVRLLKGVVVSVKARLSRVLLRMRGGSLNCFLECLPSSWRVLGVYAGVVQSLRLARSWHSYTVVLVSRVGSGWP